MDETRDVREMLVEEIASEIQAISELETGSSEKAKAIENLATLYRLRIEENKSEWEADEKYNRRIMDEAASERDSEEKQNRRAMEAEANERDYEVKQNQIAEQVKDRYFRIGIAAAELMIPLVFYGIWMKKGFKFEETGTYTSTTFKGLFNRFRPTKK